MPFDFHCLLLLQNEDDCAGHEPTKYAFSIDDQQEGVTMSDAFSLSSLSRSGDMVQVTLTAPAEMTNLSRFILTLMLSNTVKFMEIIKSSTGGVNSTVRNNTWSTTPAPYPCECKLTLHGIVSCLVI